MDWKQRRALEFLDCGTDSARAADGSIVVFFGTEMVTLTGSQVGEMIKAGTVKFCADHENAIEITDAGRAALKAHLAANPGATEAKGD